jgi:hypothetical protein
MTSLANNIIQFPKSISDRRASSLPQTLDDVAENVDIVKQVHIQESIETIIPMLFNNLAMIGFQPTEDDDFLKDGALIVESVRSFLNKVYEMHHPLQLIAQNLFVQSDEDGSLEVTDKIKLVISPKDNEVN